MMKSFNEKFFYQIESNIEEKYFHCLNANGSFDTFTYDPIEKNIKIIGSYSRKDHEKNIICGTLRADYETEGINSAYIGTIDGNIEEIYSLDSSRKWHLKISEGRVTALLSELWSPNAFCGDEDGFIYQIDETNKKIVSTLKSGKSEITALGSIEKLNLLYSFSFDSQLKIYDIRTSQKIYSIPMVIPQKKGFVSKDESILYSSFIKNFGIKKIDINEIIKNNNNFKENNTFNNEIKIENKTSEIIYDSYSRIHSIKEIKNGLLILNEESELKYLDFANNNTYSLISKDKLEGTKIMDFTYNEKNGILKVCGEDKIFIFEEKIKRDEKIQEEIK